MFLYMSEMIEKGGIKMDAVAENKNVVNDLDSAGNIFKKIKFMNEQIQEKKDYAAKERSLIDVWEQQQIKELSSKKEYFEGLIRVYFAEQRHTNSKFKLSTPWGKVSSRATKNLKIDNEEKLIEHFEMNDIEAIRTKKELDKKYINNRYKNGVDQTTGEILPYVHIEESESITIKAE